MSLGHDVGFTYHVNFVPMMVLMLVMRIVPVGMAMAMPVVVMFPGGRGADRKKGQEDGGS